MSQPIALIDLSSAGAEAQRVMTICNACRYCEGFCPVFPAMAARTEFDATTLDYMANLCHNCTACYHACQYKPPHEFHVNVPQTLTEVRLESYAKYAWPEGFGQVFERNGLMVSLTAGLCLAIALITAAIAIDPDTLFSAQTEPGAFYRIVSHTVMINIGGGTFAFALLAMTMGGLKFWRASGLGWPVLARLKNWRYALTAAATLEHLGGGHGEGCNTDSAAFSNQRRYFHQFTMWGFLLCFAATCTATLYEYGLGRLSPFPLLSLPVLLGTIGGIGLIIGPVGLLWIKLKSDTVPLLARSYGMDVALLAMLFLISLTGLILLALRETSAMGVLLMVHLGFVLAFFVTMPYSKFVHGIYRLAALLRYADETPDK